MSTRVITARNVNHAFKDAIWWLRTAGERESSRNGPVLVAPGPVVTEYIQAQERVIFHPSRDANAVFHLMESLWMLAGMSDLMWLAQFNSRMATYGENGIQWGAYGRRWRGFFGNDQIQLVLAELRARPESRRAVIGMWDPTLDLAHLGPDIPCNTHIYFDLRHGMLNMTVCCRSNDMLWGAYGANAVHFSILQEVIAHELGVPMGIYRQMSNNFHAYTEVPMMKNFLENPPSATFDYYETGEVLILPILGVGEHLHNLYLDCRNLVDGGNSFQCSFMQSVAAPLRDAYLARKAGQPYEIPEQNIDWFVAFREWDARRAQGAEA